jgi:mono/diheme cytochrome c family protein
MKRRSWIIGLAVIVAGLAVLWWRSGAPDPAAPGAGGVMVPALSETAEAGAALFEENCAACHGADGGGSEDGPPLIHKIYEPGHHADAAFYLAAQRGARSHHWQFGDMPPVEGVSEADVGRIVAFVREVQRANGIN